MDKLKDGKYTHYTIGRFQFFWDDEYWVLEERAGDGLYEVVDGYKNFQDVLDYIETDRKQQIDKIQDRLGYSNIMVERCLEEEDESIKYELQSMLYQLIV